MPAWLTGQQEVLGFTLERYRMFLVVVGGVLALVLVFGLERTRFGAMVRACVDNGRVARACGLNTELIFAVTFAIGGGLAGLAGALSANLLGIDPNFPLRYLVYLLIVVSVGGMGTISGTLIAGLVLGIADVAGKYYVPADRRLRDLRDHGRSHAVAAARAAGAARMSSLTDPAPVRATGAAVFRLSRTLRPRRNHLLGGLAGGVLRSGRKPAALWPDPDLGSVRHVA